MSTRLLELRFIPTIASHAPSLRSMETHVTNATRERFSETIDRGLTRDRITVASVAPDLMRHGTVAQGSVFLNGGFRERRYIVTAMFETVRGRNMVEIDTVMGYTEMQDVSFGGHINPETNIFFNSLTTYRLFGSGNRDDKRRYEVTSTSNLLVPVTVDDGRDLIELNELSRPEDLLLSASRAASPAYQDMVAGSRSIGSRYNDVVAVRDLRDRKEWGVMASNRAHNMSSNVLYDIMDSYHRQASAMVPGTHNQDEDVMVDLLDNARSTVRHSSPKASARGEVFRRILSHTDFGDTYAITISDLEALFPETAHILRDPDTIVRSRDTLDLSDYTDDNSGTNPEAVCSNAIVNAVTTAMASFQFASYAFVMSNYGTNFNGNPIPKAAPAEGGYQFIMDGIPSGERERRSDMFLDNMEIQLDPVLSRHCDDYEISVHAQLAGMIRIEIRMDNNRAYQYALPAYCDALYTGIYQPSSHAVTAMAMDVTKLLTDLI